jgi:hypothetical protein
MSLNKFKAFMAERNLKQRDERKKHLRHMIEDNKRKIKHIKRSNAFDGIKHTVKTTWGNINR